MVNKCSSQLKEAFTIMVFWIFGYGSLVWNPGFEYDEKLIGYIKDYKRVFDLGTLLLPRGLLLLQVLIFVCRTFKLMLIVFV